MRKIFGLVAALALVCGSVWAQETQPSPSDAAPAQAPQTVTAQTVVEPTAAMGTVTSGTVTMAAPADCGCGSTNVVNTGCGGCGTNVVASGCGCAAPAANDCCQTRNRVRILNRNRNCGCENTCGSACPSTNNCGCSAPVVAAPSCGCSTPVVATPSCGCSTPVVAAPACGNTCDTCNNGQVRGARVRNIVPVRTGRVLRRGC